MWTINTFDASEFFDLFKANPNINWFGQNERKIATTGFKLHWPKKKSADVTHPGIARIGKVLIKYRYDSNHPVAQAIQGRNRKETIIRFATDFPWQNRMANFYDSVRETFIAKNTDKLEEITSEINEKDSHAFARIENINIQLFNDLSVTDDAVTEIILRMSLQNDKSNTKSEDIKQIVNDMLKKIWSLEKNKIYSETIEVDDMLVADFGIDIFEGTGFISSGAPSGAKVPQHAESVAACAKQCIDHGPDCRAFFWTPNDDYLCHLRRNWLDTKRTYKELDQYAGIRISSAQPGRTTPDWQPSASYPVDIYTKQCQGKYTFVWWEDTGNDAIEFPIDDRQNQDVIDAEECASICNNYGQECKSFTVFEDKENRKKCILKGRWVKTRRNGLNEFGPDYRRQISGYRCSARTSDS